MRPGYADREGRSALASLGPWFAALIAVVGLASIGLTIPAIAFASIWLPGPLLLGLGATQIVLLALTATVGILTVMPGRATLLHAAVHLAICGASCSSPPTPNGETTGITGVGFPQRGVDMLRS